jgi:hypothetical protein
MSITNIIELAAPAKLPARGSSEPFADAAQWILREHEMVLCDEAATIARSAGIGEELERIKAALDQERYGQWGGWVARNLRGISERHLRRYRAIFRRKDEPLAQSDPGAFMAQVYGNLDDTAGTDSSDVNVRTGNGAAKPPSKRRSGKAKDVPPAETPSGSDASTVPGQSAGAISLEGHIGLSADALARALGGWKRESFASLREAARGNSRVEGGLDRLERDLDGLVKRLRALRTVAS